jgi:hypothetical protein
MEKLNVNMAVLLLAGMFTVFEKLSPHENDFGKPATMRETKILQDEAYFKVPFRTTLPPESGRVALEAVKDETTGTGIGAGLGFAAKAICGMPTTARVIATTGTATTTANLDRTVEPSMNFLALPIDGSPPGKTNSNPS